ncbi:MAG: hypothetical protein RRA94_14355 [Bacteroidota bacterium]|nr:hypothetical protein [Bacteroidota bacterium]
MPDSAVMPDTAFKIDAVFFIMQLLCTFAMTGIIWFVQIVHYPLMRRVGKGRFTRYLQTHMLLTTFVVAPVMLIEAAAVVYGLLVPNPWLHGDAAQLGAVLLLVVWLVTFIVHVPQHRRLAEEFEARAYRRILFGNWIRAYAWSFRSIILVFSLLRVFVAEP